MKTPQGRRDDQGEQSPSCQADIRGPAHVFLGFIRKEEMQKPREQQSQADERDEG